MESVKSLNNTATIKFSSFYTRSGQLPTPVVSEQPDQTPQEMIHLFGCDSEEALYQRIKELTELIESRREELRGVAVDFHLPDNWKLELEPRGAGATYYLIDAEGSRQGVIKPNDEDVLQMNNPKWCVSLELCACASWIAGYESAQTAAAVSALAEMAGVEEITPQTKLAILDSEQFYLIGDRMGTVQRERLIDKTHLISREKLVSMQKYHAGATPLDEVYHDHLAEGKDLELDQSDFESVMVLEWLTFENDGHMGNLMVTEREDGKWGVLKVDNNLSLPEHNAGYFNVLGYLTNNTGHKLSESIREKIASFSIPKMVELLQQFGKSENCQAAFVKRCTLLKELAAENVTIAEIEAKFRELGDSNEAALNSWSTMRSDNCISGG